MKITRTLGYSLVSLLAIAVLILSVTPFFARSAVLDYLLTLKLTGPPGLTLY